MAAALTGLVGLGLGLPALRLNGPYLLLDEPAAGLNGAETARLIEIIRDVRDETGLSVLVVEHDMRLVMSLCDRLYVLNFGKTLATGQPTEVRTDPALVTAYLGES